MRHAAFVATAVLAPMLGMAPLFAGVKIVSENTDLATKKVTTDVILLDANRLRVDSDDGRSVMFLTDGGRNRMVMLDKNKNTYEEIDEQTMQQMGQQMSAAMAQMQAAMKNMTPDQRAMMEKMMKGKMPQAAAAPPKTVYTAKGSGSVNGFSCNKYEGDLSGVKESEVCAALPAQIKLTPADLADFRKDEGVLQLPGQCVGQLPRCKPVFHEGMGSTQGTKDFRSRRRTSRTARLPSAGS